MDRVVVRSRSSVLRSGGGDFNYYGVRTRIEDKDEIT